MPSLQPGQQVIRLTPSSTGRQIQPNTLGVIGGLDPTAHINEPGRWLTYGYIPVQWVSGLWSSMAVMDKGYSWDFYPPEPENEYA